ncbi:MAG: hypothetical protein ABSE63_17955 [Thermoguttaceae bacterium]
MAKPSRNVEKTRFVPQLDADRWDTVEKFILANRPLFYTNGSVVTEWRWRNGLRFGPYFRLKYRDGNIQRSIYLGPSNQLAEKVRRLLANLQFHRTCRRLRTRLRASLRLEKKHLQNILNTHGYNMKGFDIHKSKSPRN